MTDAPSNAEIPSLSAHPETQQPSQVTFTVYHGPPLETIRSIVAMHFTTRDAFVDQYGIPTIQIVEEPAREKFKALLHDLSQSGLVAALRRSATPDTLTIRVYAKPQLKPSRKKINLVLFLVTVATMFVSGFLLWYDQDPLSNLADPSSVLVKATAFTLSLLAIIGLHEFGHKGTTVYHRLDATYPYFLPGPPPIGTFGAVISLRAPPTNRDQLFDLGLSGPIVGFLVTILVTVLSVTVLSLVVPDSVAQQLENAGRITGSAVCIPLASPGPGVQCEAPLLMLMSLLFSPYAPSPAGAVVFPNQQLWFAAHIGALLTFLNIVPAWQLDGGHISRATFGPNGHRTATLVGMILLFVSGYVLFAILLLVMMNFTRRGFAGVEPLDDVTPLKTWRKALYIVAIAMLVLTFFPSPPF